MASRGILLRTMPELPGPGVQVGLGRVQTDVASASGLLCQLVFRVRDLVMGGGHVARSNSERSRGARRL